MERLPPLLPMTTPPPVHDDVALLVVTVVVMDGLNTENFVAVVVAYCRPPPAFNDDLAVIVTSGFGDGPRETFILPALEAAAAANTSAMELLKVSGMAPELDSELLNSCALLLRCGGPVIATAALLLMVQLAAVSLNSLARLGVADTSAAAAEAATVDGLAADDS
jgi:hypothetical protein